MKFARVLYFFERVFPPREGSYHPPQDLGEVIQPTHAIFDRFLTAGGRFGSSRVSNALIAGNNTVLLAEPSAGMIQLPISVVVENPDAASRVIDVAIANTTSTPDVWGRFDASAGAVLQQRGLGGPAGGGYALLMLTVAGCVPRGNQLRVQWFGMTGGNNALTSYQFLEIPGELVTIEMMRHWTPHMNGSVTVV